MLVWSLKEYKDECKNTTHKYMNSFLQSTWKLIDFFKFCFPFYNP